MKLVKKINEVFKLVPVKKLKIISFFFSSILGYIILAFFPYITSQIIKYATQGLMNEAYKYTLILGATYIIYESVWFLNYYIYSKLQTYYCDTIHHLIFNKIASSSRKFNAKVDKGKMLSLVSEDVPGFCLLIDYTINYISAIFMFGLVIILTLKTHFLFAFIMVVSSVLYIIFINKTTEKFTAHLKEQKKHNDSINNLYLEELNGLKEIKTLQIKDKLQRKLDTKLKRHNKAYFKKHKYHQRSSNTSTLFPHYTKFILYLVLLFFMVKMNATIEIVILIIGYYDQIIDALDEILVSYKEIETYYVSVERVGEILTYEDKITSLFGDYEGDQIYGSIVFKDVCYKYDSRYILNHVNFEVKPNTLTVVVGESGSGKTTLFELLARFYNLHGGTIYLDGRDIYEYSDSIYASNLTLVKQNPFLYNMSIDQNLRLVNSNKQRRIEACKEVGIHEFIMSLKDGYRTILNQNAQNLSGGQKQLLSIARALLTDAEILLMDDITSSLDPKTISQIVELLKKLKEDHTILITTNREDVMEIADQILYIKNATLTSYKTLAELKKETGYESKVN